MKKSVFADDLFCNSPKNIRRASPLLIEMSRHVIMNRPQTPTRKTVLVFQFFVKLFVACSPLLVPTSTR